jgi:hypothetical protein
MSESGVIGDETTTREFEGAARVSAGEDTFEKVVGNDQGFVT